MPSTLRTLPEPQGDETRRHVTPGLEEGDGQVRLVSEPENSDPIASTVDVTVWGEDDDGWFGRW